jgi:hypothetical protein
MCKSHNDSVKKYTDKLVKKFGLPRFKEGDRVTSTMFEDPHTPVTISDIWHNGFSWMAYFHENEVGCSLDYLKPYQEKEEEEQDEAERTSGEWGIMEDNEEYATKGIAISNDTKIIGWLNNEYSQVGISKAEARANAKIVCKAVNMYDELVEALRPLAAMAERYMGNKPDKYPTSLAQLQKAVEVLAKADSK